MRRGTFVEADGFGECVLIRTRNPKTFDDELIIMRADPRVLLTEELLDEIREATQGPWPHPFVKLENDVLTLNGKNQRAVYRIGDYLPEHRAYVAEWPD